MLIHAAYLRNSKSPIVDQSTPLLVTSCGNYRLKNCEKIVTHRPNGRKDYQLLYIAAGKAHFYFNGTEKIVSAGNMVLYFPDQPQEYIYYKEEKTDVYWIHFTGSDVDSILERYHLHASNPIYPVGTLPDYPWIFEQIIQELQLCKLGYEDLTALHLRSILILISRSIQSGNIYDSALAEEISHAMHYFQKKYHTEIHIAEYAASRGMSSSWFIQRFKESTGFSPLQYILKLRIANAQSLLEHTDYTISEIASAVGYSNALYFSRLFHKYMGMSPKEYRSIKLSDSAE